MQHSRRRPAAALSPVTLNNHSTRASRQCTRNVTPVVSSCFGCSQPMYTPTLSTVLDHNWHPECVRCFVCRCLLNEQCYSREGKLYCKDDFIKKYIHRCFACQNLLQANEMIRRIRPGRLYHADCFVCSKCKHTLQDNDISALFKTDGSTFNEMECLCQTCLNPDKLSVSNQNRDDKVNGEHSVKTEEPSVSQTNGSILPNPTTNDHSENNEQESMEVDETTMVKSSPIKKRSSSSNSSAQAPPISTPLKATGRQSKARQSTSSNGSKRSPAKSKATPPTARQKEPSTNERKGRSPATRSKASATPPSSSVASRRSSNRRTKKPARYGKRRYVSGSDDNDTEDDEDDDEIDDHSDFTNEDENDTNEKDTHQSPVPPKATPIEVEIKNKTEPEPTVAPPPVNGGTPSLLSQVKMSEPLSLLSGLASNPMSISSIMKPDMNASFMPPNFNPAFPNPAQFLPPNHPFQPGFSLPPRLPMAVPPVTAPPPTKSTRTSHSPNDSENESLDHSSSSSQMDVSVNAESGPPTRPPTTATTKPSALSSLLEFGKLPPSNLPDIRPNGANPSPFPFPFVNPGPGVPFSPQAAAGMATFYRPPFGVPSVSSMPLDMSQSSNNGPKKKATPMENDETGHHQHLLQDSNSSKKKAKKIEFTKQRKRKEK